MEKKEVIELVKACMEACLERYAVPGMLSVEETAEKLGISKDTVRDYLRKGELTGYELGNRMMRVSVQSINELLERVKTSGKREESSAAQSAAEEPNPPSPEASASAEATADVTEDKAAEEVKPEEAKAEEAKPEEPKPEEAKPEEAKPEEAKPEEAKPEEFEQCTAVHPKSGKRCVLPAGHEGKHHCE